MSAAKAIKGKMKILRRIRIHYHKCTNRTNLRKKGQMRNLGEDRRLPNKEKIRSLC